MTADTMSGFKSIINSCLGDSSLLRTVYDEMTEPIPESLTAKQVIANIIEDYSLTKAQVKEYKLLFRKFDTDGNGDMETDEIRNMFFFWGENLTDGEFRAIIDEVRGYRW